MNDEYDLKSVKLPYLSGGLLRLFVSLVEGPLGRLLIPSLIESAGGNWLRKQVIEEAITPLPLHYTGHLAEKDSAVAEKELPQIFVTESRGFHFTTVLDYAKAYREGKTTPDEVAKKILEAVPQATNPNQRCAL